MKTKKTISILAAFVMAFTVFGCTGLSFAAEEVPEDETVPSDTYYIGFGNQNSEYYQDVVKIGDAFEYSEFAAFAKKVGEEDAYISIFEDGIPYWGVAKCVWHNNDPDVVGIRYFAPSTGDSSEEELSYAKEITVAGNPTINLRPKSAGTATLSVDFYNDMDMTEKTGTLTFTVTLTAADVSNYKYPDPNHENDPFYIEGVTKAVGGSYTLPLKQDGRNVTGAYISIDPVDTDTAVILTLTTSKKTGVALLVHETGTDETIITEVNETQLKEYARLKAGEKYYLIVNRVKAGDEIKVELAKNKVQDVKYHTDRALYKNQGGLIKKDSNGEKYYLYYYSKFLSGDTLTIIDDQGSSKKYTYKDGGKKERNWLVAGDGSKIDPDKVSVDDTYQEKPGKHWTVGSDNILPVSYAGVSSQYHMTITEVPDMEVKFEAAKQFRIAEDDLTKGRYNLPDWNNGDIITLNFKDGSALSETYVYNDDTFDWEQKGGNKVLNDYMLKSVDDQATKAWNRTPRKTNFFYAEYAGVRSNAIEALIEKSVGKAKVTLSKGTYVYDGKKHKPSIKSVQYKGTKLKSGRDYAVVKVSGVTIPSAKGIGEYGFIMEGKGSYLGYNNVSFKILPKGAAISTPKAGTKSLTVKWKKQGAKMSIYSAKAKHITGYQVQYSLKKNFKDAKIKTVKGYKKTSVKIKNLEKNKKYYVRVRTYMKNPSDSNKFYSKWSKTKKIKTK